MDNILSGVDLVVFISALVLVMGIGLYAGRKEETAQDYFLAGNTIPWWGVAGSIFGSNVSANHLVGMLGIGFSVGFAQSHFELGAIAGLMLLCYGFLPVYRRLGIYTLSEYLGRRYDDRSRLLYAVIMIQIMVFVQLVAGFYIGSRSLHLLLQDSPIDLSYRWGVVALAVITAGYTIRGGLKAVIWTDAIQSFVLLGAAMVVAFLTFQEVGGWNGLMALDAALPPADQKMHLYLPSDHPDLPWSGVFTGLLAMHFFYWGTNQFIVQRALAARSDQEARLGIVAAGFFKLLIPFMSISTGIAAAHVFAERLPGVNIDPDAAFPELVKLVVPFGWGIVGLIAAGLIGAIMSSVDSMMNSTATIVTFDIYQRYINREASDRQMIFAGRVSIVVFVTLAALLAIFVLDPESDENFFLTIVDQQGHLTPGLLVAFGLGMFWPRATARGALAAIVGSTVFSVCLHFGYRHLIDPVQHASVVNVLGTELNFLHRAALTVLFGLLVHVAASLTESPDPEKSKLAWSSPGSEQYAHWRRFVRQALASGLFFAVLGGNVVAEFVAPWVAAWLGAVWTFGQFLPWVVESLNEPSSEETFSLRLLREDRLWSGLLCAIAVWIMFYFY